MYLDTITEQDPLDSNMTLQREVSRAIELATQHARLTVHLDGHWAGPLLSDTSFTTQHIFTLVSLSQSIPEPDRKAYITYFLSTQEDDGSWALAPKYPYGGNLSVTVETYLALKMLGFPPSHPAMENARNWILEQGGLEKVRNTTRVFLAMFGIISWSSIPQLPPELILLPTWFPLSIFKTGMWATTVIVPLLVLRSHEPVYQLPVGSTSDIPSPACYLDELWCNKSPPSHNNKLKAKHIPYTQPVLPLLLSNPITLLFQLVDLLLLYLLSPILSCLPTRRIAIDRCMAYMIARQEPEGPYGGFTICLCFYLQCLALEGYDASSSPEISSGLEALRDNVWEWSGSGGDDDGESGKSRRHMEGRFLQASTSPIWDTLLVVRGLLDCRQAITSSSSSSPEDSSRDTEIDGLVRNALQFIRSKEIREANVGDWQVYRPGVGPGAYSFEYVNRWFPDVDDTAVAVLTFLEADKVLRAVDASSRSTSSQREAEIGITRRRRVAKDGRSSDGVPSREQGFSLDPESRTREQEEKEGQEEREKGHIIRAAKWCLGMQNADGGWAAFDSSDGARWLWNSIVFSDMDCMCDSSCPDIRGRCLEMLGLLRARMEIPDDRFKSQIEIAVHRGLDYLRETQAEFGGWWARWGINYLYGTSNALCGLYHFRDLPRVKEMIQRGIAWIEAVQNTDGGWGEQDDSFVDPSRAGKGPSTPSQTAWALMALLRHVSPMKESVTRGVRWLVENQKVSARSPVLGGRPGAEKHEVSKMQIAAENGTWEQEIYTGVGYPNQVCFGYDMYRSYFPMIALGRYLSALENRICGKETHVKEGGGK